MYALTCLVSGLALAIFWLLCHDMRGLLSCMTCATAKYIWAIFVMYSLNKVAKVCDVCHMLAVVVFLPS